MRAKDLLVNATRKPRAANVDALRPDSFDSIIGQKNAVLQLELLCGAAKLRGEVAPHILIDGPPGLGKTTMAQAVATEMSGPLWACTGQSIGLETLGKRLSTQRAGSLIFVDECHTLSKSAVTMLLGALEDGVVDMTTPVGAERRDVQPFTLVAATTNPGDLSKPLKDRFGLVVQLDYYPTEDILKIMERSRETLNIDATVEGLTDVAERSHGVPRIANSYLQRVRDYCQVNHPSEEPGDPLRVTGDMVADAFTFFDIDDLGLAPRDRQYITVLYDRFRGGPVGGENMAIALGMDLKTVINDLEPLLMRLGLVVRASRGRILTGDGRKYARELVGDVD